MGAVTTVFDQGTVETSAGTCQLPIVYRDGSLLACFYAVPPEAASQLLEGTPFEPLTFAGRALAILAGFEYRDTSIGRYREVGLAVWARLSGARPSLLGVLLDPRKQREQAIYIARLPVTTTVAHAAGRELWGYPKYVAGIETHFGPRESEIALEGEFRLRAPRPRGLTLKGMPLVLYSVLKGRVLRTIVEVQHRSRWGRGGSVRLEITGKGPTADAMKTLGLHDRRPTAVFQTDRMRSTLPLGRDIGGVNLEGRDEGGPGRIHQRIFKAERLAGKISSAESAAGEAFA